MENSDWVLTLVLTTLGTLLWVALMVATCYCYHLRRRKMRSEEDTESLQTILPADHNGKSSTLGSASASSTSLNGIIGFRAPLIRTRSVG
jgi:hypothetical protein